jgi:hypothetical protein
MVGFYRIAETRDSGSRAQSKAHDCRRMKVKCSLKGRRGRVFKGKKRSKGPDGTRDDHGSMVGNAQGQFIFPKGSEG